MKYKIKLFIIYFTMAIMMSIGLASCSSTPATQNTAATQPSPTPSTGTENTAMTVASPSPNAAATETSPASQANPSVSGAPPPGSGAGSKPGESAKTSQAQPIVEAPKPPRIYTIPAGTAISVYTSSDLSTKANRSGQRFTASLGRDLVDDGYVVAKRGAAVDGVIVSADSGGRVKGRASLTLKLDRLTLADGKHVSLATSSYTKQAKGSVKKDAAKIGIGAGIGAAIGAIAGGGKGAGIGALAGGGGGTGLVLATKGEPAVIPSESQLTFRLTAPITVTK